MNLLSNLALSETGFVFDPSTGNTFVANETALAILRALQKNKEINEISGDLLAEYDVSSEELARDLSDFKIQLKEMGFEI